MCRKTSKKTNHENTRQPISSSRQVNTLFCLIAAKKGRGKWGERERKRERKRAEECGERKLLTLGELWLQAFVSNLKTKSSGNIKTSFKNNINIFFVGSIWHSITLNMYTIPKQFSHTPTSINRFVANKTKKSISKLSQEKEIKSSFC